MGLIALQDHFFWVLYSTSFRCSGRAMAQLVARLVWDQEVEGSSPSGPTTAFEGDKSSLLYGGDDFVFEKRILDRLVRFWKTYPIMKTVVAKFGGTSMGSAEAIASVADIIQKNSCPTVAVVSATSGTTDSLIVLGREAMTKGAWEGVLHLLQDRHEKIIKDLGIACDLSPFWSDVEKIVHGVAMLGELSLSTLDRLQSFGERMSATILVSLLRRRGMEAVVLDAYDIVFTDNNFGAGNVHCEKTYARAEEIILAHIEKGVIPVVTGFIGQSESGQYITLGRGGSDYSGALIAAAIGAEELQIWTDVDGILNTDPRLVPSAKVLEQLSFYEAGELAYFGAKVLHPKTIKPAVEKNIPVRILNTFNPSARGTVITNEERQSIKAVTYKKGVTIVNISSLGMLNAHGFLARIFDVFAQEKVIVDVIATSEVSVSLTVDHELPKNVVQKLGAFASVEVHEQKAIVCLVGGGIRTQKDLLRKLFTAVEEFEIHMISQGASKRNITFAVNQDDATTIIKKIFDAFFL